MREKNIPYADLTNFFQERVPKRDYFEEYKWPIDGHYNARGYELLARGIEDVLCKRLDIDGFPSCLGDEPG